ncbi:Frag1/DRAM/Sfk1 family domain containing protein [Elaphomyces granulatus]
MPRWGRPPGARPGRQGRGRGLQWVEEEKRFEEIESEEDSDDRDVRPVDSSRSSRRLANGNKGLERARPRGPERDSDGDLTDGDNYDLNDDTDSTVAYAIQLAKKDKEELLVEKAIERIRRAQTQGKRNVRVSQRELAALERKRKQANNTKGYSKEPSSPIQVSLTDKHQRSAESLDSVERRRGSQDETYASWGKARETPTAYYTLPRTLSPSPSQRSRTPTTQHSRPYQPSSPAYSPHEPYYQAYSSVREPRSNSSSGFHSPARSFHDDPQWTVLQHAAAPNGAHYLMDPALYRHYYPPSSLDPRYGSQANGYAPSHEALSYSAFPPLTEEYYHSSPSEPLPSQRVPPIKSDVKDEFGDRKGGSNGTQVEAAMRPVPTSYETRAAAGQGGRRRNYHVDHFVLDLADHIGLRVDQYVSCDQNNNNTLLSNPPSTLIALLASWCAQGKPRYASMHDQQTIAYISDVGAEGLKPLFIAGGTVTVVFLDLALLSERWLRHTGQLIRNQGRLDKFSSVISIFFSVVGALGLILLSVFDVRRHHRLHDGFLSMFIVGYLISAIFLCLEYGRLGISHRERHVILYISFWVKLAFVVVELALSIAFGLCLRRSGRQNTAAVLEWIIGLLFTFYIVSFVMDLLPAVRKRQRLPQGEKELTVTTPASPSPSSSGHGIPPSHGDRDRDRQPNARYYERSLPTDSTGDNNADLSHGQAVVVGDPISSHRSDNYAYMPRAQQRISEV